MGYTRKQLIITVFKEFFKENSLMHGAALAYYAILALVPLLYLAVTFFGSIVGHETMISIIDKVLREHVGLSDVSGILSFLDEVDLGGGSFFLQIVGVVALIFSSTAILSSLRSSINVFYNLDILSGGARRQIVKGLLSRLISMAFIMGATVLIVIFYFAETIFLSVGNEWFQDYTFLNNAFTYFAQHGISIVSNLIIFLFIFKFLHDGKVLWRRAIEGALITSILLYVGQLLIQFYLTNYFFGSSGGVVGTILVILVWVYYSSQIIFLGAKYIAVKSKFCNQEITIRD